MANRDSPDNDLLARLNALKKSSVNLDTNYSASIAPANPPEPTDGLAARFARLGSPSPSASPQPSRATSSNHTGALVVAPGAPNYLEGIAQSVGGSKVEFNEEDEKSLEELLGELNGAVGDRKEWDVSKKEQQDVGKLLKDMRRILPEVVNNRTEVLKDRDTQVDQSAKEKLTDWESIEVNVGSGEFGRAHKDIEDHDDDGEDGKTTTDEDETDDVIARVMAELEISKKHDPPSPPPEDDRSGSGGGKDKSKADTEDDSLDLPSAPKTLPEPEDDFTRSQAFEDVFTARLAALAAPSPSQTDSLGLPSAPSFAPSKKPPVSTSLQKKVDDEIDTWCIICQDDATLKCLGCDGDLYCQNCWMEGHRGESAGFEERRHKAMLYSKKKKQTAV